MIQIMMICHGNICRSPMAEFVMRDLIRKEGLEDCIRVSSAATSREEIGNPVHPGTKKILASKGIFTEGKFAVQVRKKDYEDYDFLIGMEDYNLANMKRIVGEDKDHKIYRLLDFTDSPGDIADPWYTGNFQRTYEDVLRGCKGLIDYLKRQLDAGISRGLSKEKGDPNERAKKSDFPLFGIVISGG